MAAGEMQAKPGGMRDALYKLWRKFRNSFTTTEMRTGAVWTDGKEIYRKVVSMGALPNATTKNTAHGITGIGTVLSLRGMATNGTTQIPLPRPDGYTHAVDEGGAATYTVLVDAVELSVTATNVVMITTSDLSAFTASFAIVEYTKA